jgi:UDP-GlcNAc3NAcA epimerase
MKRNSINKYVIRDEGISNLTMIEPVDYSEMVRLQQSESLIMTDSGGIQKVAYWLKVPCITKRDETEWVETVFFGFNKFVGTETKISSCVQSFSKTSRHLNIYGPTSVKASELYVRS